MAARFDPKSYLEVKDRLPLYWGQHPDGRIETEIVMISEDWARVIVRASVFRHRDDAHPAATGLAEETQTPNGGGANRFSHIENCETSAIGRALANYRYQGGMQRPSREEMEKGERREEAEQARRAPASAPVARDQDAAPAPRPEVVLSADAAWFRTRFEERTITPRDANEYATELAGERVRLSALSPEDLAAARAHFAALIENTAAAPAA